jgi:hypothetical protein
VEKNDCSPKQNLPYMASLCFSAVIRTEKQKNSWNGMIVSLHSARNWDCETGSYGT